MLGVFLFADFYMPRYEGMSNTLIAKIVRGNIIHRQRIACLLCVLVLQACLQVQVENVPHVTRLLPGYLRMMDGPPSGKGQKLSRFTGIQSLSDLIGLAREDGR